MKIEKKNTMQYFILEKNPLNNEWMLFSKCNQLPQCYHGTKADMIKLQRALNKQCEIDRHLVDFPLTWRD